MQATLGTQNDINTCIQRFSRIDTTKSMCALGSRIASTLYFQLLNNDVDFVLNA